MELNVNLHRFGDPRPLALVVGHERAGNHFLMNAIAACCGYSTTPYIDLDHPEININFHQPDLIENVLNGLAAEHAANVVKSHHHAAFFAPIVDQLADHVQIFYIHRDPVAVIESFWRFVHGWPWAEGPKVGSVVEFALAQPEGRLMRYQMHQHDSMLRRWQAHAESWLSLAAKHDHVTALRYENLRDGYDDCMAEICAILGCSLETFPAPDRDDYIKAVSDDALTISDDEHDALGALVRGTIQSDIL